MGASHSSNRWSALHSHPGRVLLCKCKPIMPWMNWVTIFTCGGATRSIAPQRYRQLLRTWFNIWTPIPQIKPFIIERQFINGGLGTILSQSPFKKFCPIPYLCHILSKIISHWGIGTFINQVPFFHRHIFEDARNGQLDRFIVSLSLW